MKSFPALTCSFLVQTERKGPAHAVWLADGHISAGDDLLIVFNDTIFDTDLSHIRDRCAGADGLIYSKEVEDYQRFGVNVVADNYIVTMVEKPDTPVSNLAQVGLYYLEDGKRFMGYLAAAITAGDVVKGEYYLPAVFMRMIVDGCLLKAPKIDAWMDCGKPETILETNAYLLKGRHHIHGEAHNSKFIEPVHIECGAVIRDSIISPNVSVASGSVIERSIIRDSIINGNVTVLHMVLSHSILGDNVTLVRPAQRMNIGDDSQIEMHCITTES